MRANVKCVRVLKVLMPEAHTPRLLPHPSTTMKLLQEVITASIIFLLRHDTRVVAFSPLISTRHTSERCITTTSNTRYHRTSSQLFNWFQRNEKSPEGIKFTSSRGEQPGEEELMHRTVKMMENHRRSQEAAERTSSIMEELSNTVVTGRSRGFGAMGLGSGVKVTYDGTSRPINVEVDPKFLFGSSESGVISVEDLNTAITEAMVDGYMQSCRVMEEKMKGLYEQLGLPKEGGK
jgi:DNA-binding protein YbaB